MSGRRRDFLATALGAGAALFAEKRALSQEALFDLGQQLARQSETYDVLAEAQRLGISGPVAAGPLQTLNPLDLADIVAAALDRPYEAGMIHLAQRAGRLLSDLPARDGLDLVPDEPVPAAPAFPYTTKIEEEYSLLARRAQISPDKLPELARVARFIASPEPKRRYLEVQSDLMNRVPWYIVGALHYREASLNFMGHLHNGDPLLQQTVHVPEHQPPAPWPPLGVTDLKQLWRLSAKNALARFASIMTASLAGSTAVAALTVQRMLYGFESYNGFGCRAFNVPSPYLWNYTDNYKAGGFPRDHVFDPNYKSKQAGLFAIIKQLNQLDPAGVLMSFALN
jgi:lysozyme family protein